MFDFSRLEREYPEHYHEFSILCSGGPILVCKMKSIDGIPTEVKFWSSVNKEVTFEVDEEYMLQLANAFMHVGMYIKRIVENSQ